MKINHHDITSYDIPTREEIITYLKGQGYPNVETEDKWMIESFVLPENYDRRFQFWKAVHDNIDLCDFDRWQHFENIIGYELRYEAFQEINNIFYGEDIEILEMDSPKKTIW